MAAKIQLIRAKTSSFFPKDLGHTGCSDFPDPEPEFPREIFHRTEAIFLGRHIPAEVSAVSAESAVLLAFQVQPVWPQDFELGVTHSAQFERLG